MAVNRVTRAQEATITPAIGDPVHYVDVLLEENEATGSLYVSRNLRVLGVYSKP